MLEKDIGRWWMNNIQKLKDYLVCKKEYLIKNKSVEGMLKKLDGVCVE